MTSRESDNCVVLMKPSNVGGGKAVTWVLAQKPWIIPIPGTRKLERLEENLGAVDIELTTEELSDLNVALSKIEISGDCYPAGSEYANRTSK